jgi:hypothetical protein
MITLINYRNFHVHLIKIKKRRFDIVFHHKTLC